MNDKTDAGVSGATVVIRNLETGTERTLTTVVSGHYNASALPVGHYEIAVSKAGFQTDRRSSLNLVVGQREESTSSCKSDRWTKRWRFLRFLRWCRSPPKTTPAWSANAR